MRLKRATIFSADHDGLIVNEELIEIEHGKALVIANGDIRIKAGGKNVFAKRGTILWISIRGKSLEFANLFDRARNSVIFEESTAIPIGHEIAFCDPGCTSLDSIARRHLTWNSSRTAFCAEVSIPYLLLNDRLVKEMRFSKTDTVHARALLKISTALHTLDKSVSTAYVNAPIKGCGHD